MRLEESVRVEHPPERVFELVSDLAGLAGCVPGLQLGERRDDSGTHPVFTGRWSIRVGSLNPTYSGTAQVLWADAATGTIGIRAHGVDESGHGAADALVEATVQAEGAGSVVLVHTDLSIRGRGAQFGHGVLIELTTAHAEQIGSRIDAALSQPPPAAPAPAPALQEPAEDVETPEPAVPSGSAARCAPPIAAAAGAVALLGWLLVRRGRRS